ncbi:MAG: RagB/SusD family nutrient uptake outer membrane protein [Acidobacterium ailaaui]|nr:RagB/SusD family nutrient uptake outer membrane protein [Pseudacidobacterium ailaaui]
MKKSYLLFIIGVTFISCRKYLNEPVYSQLSSQNFLVTEDGIASVLNASLAEGFISGYDAHSVQDILNWCTDIDWETGGGENRTASLMINFAWDPSIDWLYNPMWQRPYFSIRDANIVIDNINNVFNLSTEKRNLYIAEARFIRALDYYHLYMWFGPVPIRKHSNDSLELSRPSDEEMRNFIESELISVIPDLPNPGEESHYGLPNKGSAMALLCKFYLNTKQWQKCAEIAQKIIDLNYYSLYPDYFKLFHVENEINREFILVDPQVAKSGYGNNYINGAFPPQFYKDPISGLTMQPNWNNWAAQYRLYDSFFNSFEPGDKRKSLIIYKYINLNGDTISLLNNDNTRSFKYWPDPNAVSNDHGNDIPEIRYADILLSLAESLNEINGPNQESIDLINLIRKRAGLPDIYLSSFHNKDELNEHILKERGWEFYDEVGIRREDQIRMGTFISSAVNRGHINAKPYMIRFPIPQREIDANHKIVQNPGY